ncbi:MAG: hypothetical protein KDA59_11305, partial [Planctomycetales bacterium]|nr:hypothetical protein [Planctomycetales bacterium]
AQTAATANPRYEAPRIERITVWGRNPGWYLEIIAAARKLNGDIRTAADASCVSIPDLPVTWQTRTSINLATILHTKSVSSIVYRAILFAT